MKDKVILSVLVLLAVLVIASITVSAKTLVAGKIYNADYSDTIAGADVNVTCNQAQNSTTSESDGTYAVSFNESDCTIGDSVIVAAVKGDLYGERNGTVWDGAEFNIPCDISVVNVPLIPEFGIIAGVLTLVSAISIFFFVRRK